MTGAHEAILWGDLALLMTVVQMNRNLLRETDHRGWLPLHRACAEDNSSMVEYLLSVGSSLQAQSQRGETGLYLACRMGAARVVRLLLSRGADPQLTLTNGKTPLMAAVQSSSRDCVRLLLAHGGCLIDAVDEWGQTALFQATLQHYGVIVHLLLEAGADPTVRNAEGETAAERARGSSYPHIFHLLKVRVL